MLREALDDGPNDHDHRADHDRPPPSPPLRYVWSDGDPEDGSKLVARVDEAEKTRFDLVFTILTDATAAKI